MKHAPILLVIAAGGLFGWLAPSGGDENNGVEAANAAQSAEQRLATLQQDQWLAGEVVLPRADDGHFYAEVSVNGGSALMLVDTGASMVALTDEDADTMGVAWNESEIRPVAQGASGPVYGVNVQLENVTLGDLEAQQVDAVVIPEGLGISLLGQSFLSKIQRVEMAGDQMVLGG